MILNFYKVRDLKIRIDIVILVILTVAFFSEASYGTTNQIRIVNRGEVVKIGETGILYLNFKDSTGLIEGVRITVLKPTSMADEDKPIAEAEIIKKVKNIAIAKITSASGQVEIGDTVRVYGADSADTDAVAGTGVKSAIATLKILEELTLYPEPATEYGAETCPYGESTERKVPPVGTASSGEIIEIIDVLDCAGYAYVRTQQGVEGYTKRIGSYRDEVTVVNEEGEFKTLLLRPSEGGCEGDIECIWEEYVQSFEAFINKYPESKYTDKAKSIIAEGYDTMASWTLHCNKDQVEKLWKGNFEAYGVINFCGTKGLYSPSFDCTKAATKSGEANLCT
ncbi:MAG: hypothetical protein HC808_11550, partial [Candidatus Competibacteraceae bacterium]|nr:hypothetical protein [Candidatus Competibacteraceae bacterium]